MNNLRSPDWICLQNLINGDDEEQQKQNPVCLQTEVQPSGVPVAERLPPRGHVEQMVMLTPSPIQQAGNSLWLKAQWKAWSRLCPSP